MSSMWRVACVRIPRFPIVAVWRRETVVASGPGRTSPEPNGQLGLNLELPARESQLLLAGPNRPMDQHSPASAGVLNRSFAGMSSSLATLQVAVGVEDGARGSRGGVGPAPIVHWDDRLLALAEGSRVRVVTTAAGHERLRAGMTVNEARSRCTALTILPWDEVAIADEVRRVTAALLMASPQVTPVAGAPGTWWVGASGFSSLGGESGLSQTLLDIARMWHPGARVAIADSCVAARAATWDMRPERQRSRPASPSDRRRTTALGSAEGAPHQESAGPGRLPIVVPPGHCASYLAEVPLGLIPMDEELRDSLFALGIRTAGPLAALSPEDVERRWGALGLAAWHLARGDDERRPVLTRVEAARTVTAELSPSVSVMEPALFLVRAALDRLVRELIADGRAAAVVAITLTLDDAQGAMPSHGRAHTITREVRLPRPLARVVPLLERCRALLEKWELTAPICAVSVAVTATAPLNGEQGELLDPAWRDPAAADAAFARLRAALGPQAIVRPIVRDEHRPEWAGGWDDVTVDAIEQGLGRESREAFPNVRALPAMAPTILRRSASTPRARDPQGRPPRPFERIAVTPPAASLFELSAAFRHLETPELVDVECTGERPRALWWRGRHVRVRYAIGPERLAGDWWKDPYARDYWRCEQEDPLAHLLVFRERRAPNDQWYVQGWYD